MMRKLTHNTLLVICLILSILTQIILVFTAIGAFITEYAMTSTQEFKAWIDNTYGNPSNGTSPEGRQATGKEAESR